MVKETAGTLNWFKLKSVRQFSGVRCAKRWATPLHFGWLGCMSTKDRV